MTRILQGVKLTVTVERVGENIHCHDIEESFRAKMPELLRAVIRGERGKNYSAAQVMNAVRGVGLNDSSIRLKQVVDSSLKRYV